MSDPSSPLIVCFGDSLTAGFQVDFPGGLPGPDRPYGEFLQQWLGIGERVVISGVCGELTQDMVKRFEREVISLGPRFVVILGGTNDLGWGVTPQIIHQHIVDMYKRGQNAGIRPIGVTVPSIREHTQFEGVSTDNASLPPWLQSHIDQRVVLNGMIQDSCSELKIPCVDLFTGTSSRPHYLLAQEFSSDGLHLNAAGYKRFAELIWQEVFASQ